MTANAVALNAQCLCKAQTFTTTIPRTSLPLKGSSCHCDSCRHVTGALRSADAEWPGPAADIAAAANSGDGTLKRYQFSPRSHVLFCGVCGSKMFWEDIDSPQAYQPQSAQQQQREAGEARYFVFAGVLSAAAAAADGDGDGEDVGVGRLVRYEDHIFAGDTLDGGAVCWLRRLNGEDDAAAHPVRVWLGGRGKSEQVPPGEQWPAIKDLAAHGKSLKAAGEKEGSVPIRCKCGGVDFVLRAGEAQRDFEARQKNGEQLPFFVDPVTHKFLASLDCCDSCRIWAGSEMMNWTFSLLKHISFAGGKPVDGDPGNITELRAAVDACDPRLGTLKYYASSPGVQRYFCGRCSASVFYACDGRPDIVDIALGLLASPDGARAESVTSWSLGGQFSWEQDMVGTWREGMLHAVKKDSEQWRIERGYPKSWLRVAREQKAQAGGN
ncbi:hypothetical protein C8A03DRAFT_47261 [Achaetomium macrosporum]|uniref:CENP-V/GFA domain-containing protein n=1 Tax=Achaetomium macrosporum TaxID=79813 RepID=A0AAN7C2Y2_9PEZI|nr:hypothetical protein C8A03DRAFT_47261 [Achaetomium macrosporum]